MKNFFSRFNKPPEALAPERAQGSERDAHIPEGPRPTPPPEVAPTTFRRPEQPPARHAPSEPVMRRQPGDSRGQERSPEASRRGLSDQSSPASHQRGSGADYQHPSARVADRVDTRTEAAVGRPTETSPQREATTTQGGQHPYHRYTLGPKPGARAVIVGGTVASRDQCVLDTTISHISNRLEPTGRPALVVDVNLAPGGQSVFGEVDPDNTFDYFETEAGDEKRGLIPTLSGPEQIEALASAFSPDDMDLRDTYKDVLNTLRRRLSTEQDPETGHFKTVPLSLAEIRDGVRVVAGAQFGFGAQTRDAPTLSPERAERAYQCINTEVVRVCGDKIHQLKAAMNDAFPEPNDGFPEPEGRPSPGAAVENMSSFAEPRPEGVTVASIIVTDEKQQRLAVAGLRGLLRSRHVPAGIPNLVVIRDADRAPKALLEDVLNDCETRGIPVVLSLRKLGEVGVTAATTGGRRRLCIMPMQPEDATALAPLIPHRTGSEVTSESRTTGSSTGDGHHWSQGANYEHPGDVPKGGNTGVSADLSNGVNESYTQGVTVGAIPVLRHDDLTGIPEGHIVVTEGTKVFLFDMRTGQYVGPYPPRPKPIEVEDRIRHVSGTVATTERAAREGRAPQLAKPPAPVQWALSLSAMQSPRQRFFHLKRLLAGYDKTADPTDLDNPLVYEFYMRIYLAAKTDPRT